MHYYCYATISGDTLIPSSIKAHNAEQRSVSEQQFLQRNSSKIQNFAFNQRGLVLKEFENAVSRNEIPKRTIAHMWCTNQTRVLTEAGCDIINDEYINWYVRYPGVIDEVEYTGRSISVTPRNSGKLTIRIENACGCEPNNDTTYIYNIWKEVEMVVMSYPNPVVPPTLPIRIESSDTGTANMALFSATATTQPTYTIELWSDILGRIRSVETCSSVVDLDVSGLSSGWYQLLLLQEGQIVSTGKVLIAQ